MIINEDNLWFGGSHQVRGQPLRGHNRWSIRRNL